MTHKRRILMAIIFALILSTFIATAAFAHACTPADKLPGAGSIGVYNVVTETFQPGTHEHMTNGGFVTITDGATFAVDIFIHTLLPEGALASGPGGDDLCDGHGVDYFLACIGAAGG
jgi:hypothetical protein